MLQGEVLFFIFGEIQSLGFQWNTLAGVIFEFPALVLHGLDAPFGAEDGILVQLGTIGAVGAGALHTFPKQHCMTPFLIDGFIIHQPIGECYCYFAIF